MREIPLGRTGVTLVDDDDFEWLSRFAWKVNAQGYAITCSPPHVRMHRLILGLPRREVDHVNGIRLDNRKANLRKATHAQNCHNRKPRSASGFKGVYLVKRRKRVVFAACIRPKGRTVNLGYFDKAEEAAKAYDRAAVEAFGSFAWLNFPDQQSATQEAA